MKFLNLRVFTIKVTLISCAVFALIFLGILGILWIQFSFVYSKHRISFEMNAQNFFSEIISSNIFTAGEKFENIKETTGVFTNFGEEQYSLSESIIFYKDTKTLVFPEILEYLNLERLPSDSEMSTLFSLKERRSYSLSMAGVDIFVYRVDIGEYSIFYYGYALSFYHYYYALFLDIGVVLVLILFGSLALSSYFSQLVIRPIREQNISLSLYNHNLAHEIKTPLAVIQSNFDMFEITKNPDFIASSREELLHIENITNSLLFLTDAKNNRENFIETNIIEIIEDILPRFPFLNFEKNFKKNPIFASIDVRLFSILIKNIIENASKYASDKNVEIISEKNYILFQNAISENINSSELKKIEQIFYQSDNSRMSEGYGLGIPMMRKICEVFGWKMKISSYDKKFEVKIFL